MAKDDRSAPPPPKYDIAVSWGLCYPNTGDRPQPQVGAGKPLRRNPWGKQ